MWSTFHLPRIRSLKYPTGYETDEKVFQDIVEREATEFKPLGQKIYSYQRASPSSRGKGKRIASATDLDPESEDVIEYEVYHVGIYLHLSVFRFPNLHFDQSTWDTPGFREYHRRMQIFILLYIEGGSYIVEDESAWEFAVL